MIANKLKQLELLQIDCDRVLEETKKECNDERERIVALKKEFDISQISDPITLNIGGKCFSTSLSTITSVKGSYFETMFSGAIKPRSMDGHKNTYFIDRPLFFKASVTDTLLNVIAKQYNNELPREFISNLLYTGAVYHRPPDDTGKRRQRSLAPERIPNPPSPIRMFDGNQVVAQESLIKVFYEDNGQGTIELGDYTHWMKPTKATVKELSNTPVDTWHDCVLRVVGEPEKRAVNMPISDKEEDHLQVDLMRSADDLDMAVVGTGRHRRRYKRLDLTSVDVELITGRTHQIRAQMSHMGYSIVGDKMYGGRSMHVLADPTYRMEDAPYPHKSSLHSAIIGLVSFQLSFTCPITNQDYFFTLDPHSPNYIHPPTPTL
eukprot:gene7775-9121_t